MCVTGFMLMPGRSYSQSPFHDSITALKTGNQYEIARTNFLLGKIAIAENRLDAAQSHLFIARDLTRNTAHYQLFADALEQLCLLFEMQGNYEEAQKLAREMIPIRIRSNEIAKIPSSYLILGNIFQLIGTYDSAIFYFNKALTLYGENRNSTGKAKVFNNIGNVHYYLGNYDTAIQYYLKSLQIKVEQNDTVAQSKTLNNIAAIYYQTGNLPKSLQYYRNCMSLLRSMGHEPHLAIVYGNIGLVFYDMKNYDSAMQYYAKALALYKKHKMVKGIAATLTNTGLLKYDLHQYREALTDFESALALNREIGDESETALTLQHMASTYLATGQTDQALRHAMQSLEMCSRHGLKKQQMEVHQLLARIYSGKEQYKQAFIHLNAFINIKDSVFSNEQREALNRVIEKYELERKEKQINLLQTEKKTVELELQKRDLIVYGIALIFLLVAIIAALLFNRFRIKRNQLQTGMEIKMNEAEQRLVQSRLNPHAISNALRTIEKMIINQDAGQASLHLKRFESYVRHLLDKSAGSMITLRQEVAFLQTYLEMEIDFAPGKFTGKISVSPDLLPDEIEISPMFIQPYVENSIRHGVKHLGGPGLIEIAFSKKDNHLVCTIVDNGIGRKASADLYRTRRELYPSAGSGLLDERRMLLKKLGRIDIDLETTDLTDNAGNAAGTLVTIRFELDE
jgi:tetratricopeptide (TPR) repeat protein